MWSVARGDTNMIDILCNDKACNTNDEDEAGYTALHIAGNEEAILQENKIFVCFFQNDLECV